MGFQLDVNVPAAAVFIQGLLSFFSPCVLPLIPLYIGYLSGGTARRGEDGKIHYKQSRVMLHTVFFVIGVSFAFFVLGLGVSAAGMFFKSNQLLFARIGGVVVILFGLSAWISWLCRRLRPFLWVLPSALPGHPVWGRLWPAC